MDDTGSAGIPAGEPDGWFCRQECRRSQCRPSCGLLGKPSMKREDTTLLQMGQFRNGVVLGVFHPSPCHKRLGSLKPQNS
jgi:hypothetical protein